MGSRLRLRCVRHQPVGRPSDIGADWSYGQHQVSKNVPILGPGRAPISGSFVISVPSERYALPRVGGIRVAGDVLCAFPGPSIAHVDMAVDVIDIGLEGRASEGAGRSRSPNGRARRNSVLAQLPHTYAPPRRDRRPRPATRVPAFASSDERVPLPLVSVGASQRPPRRSNPNIPHFAAGVATSAPVVSLGLLARSERASERPILVGEVRRPAARAIEVRAPSECRERA